VNSCIHHWEIEPADGPTSKGVCGVCGMTRRFQNYTGEPETWKTKSQKLEDVYADPPTTQVKTVEPG
jgi:hypothetical protein